MSLLGQLCIWIALLMAGWGTVVSFAAAIMRRGDLAASGRRALYVAAGALALANAGVIAALVRHDYSFAYVARHTSRDLSAAYSVTALWSGTAGALLVAALALASFGAAAVLRRDVRRRLATAWTTGAVGTLLLAVTAMLCFVHDPYARLGWLSADGLGLAPMLRHAETVPMRLALLVGLAAMGMAVALAFGVAMDEGRVHWPAVTRPWLLAAWTLLSLGLALRMRGQYAYAPGGGIWQWTPLATTALVAWAVAGRLLHLRAGAAGDRWRVGEQMAHAGVVVVLVGLAAGAFGSTRAFALSTGDTGQTGAPFGAQWRFVSQGVSRYGTTDHDVTAVTLQGWRNGDSQGLIVSQYLTYGDDANGVPPVNVPVPALRASPLTDLRVSLDSTSGDRAYVRVSFVPLAAVLWLGAVLTVLGGVLAMLPVKAGRQSAPAGEGEAA